MSIQNKNFEKKWLKRFQNYSKIYTSEAQVSGWSEHSLERRIKTLCRSLKSIELTNEVLLLDLGCGAGTYCRLFVDLGYRIVGLDYSIESLQRAKNFNAKKPIPFIQGEIYHLPFIKNKLDGILCIGVFQTISDEYEAIAEISRILKDEGILFLMTLNSLSVKEITKRLFTMFRINFIASPKSSNDLRTYNPFKLKRQIQQYGYSRVKIRGVYIFPKFMWFLEKALERLKIFQIMDEIPFLFIIFAKAFLIVSRKSNG